MATRYQWDSRDYSKSSSEQQRWARELIGKLQLTGTEQVLDIGSGDGKITAEIARMLPHGAVIGIDNSPDMIAFSQNHYPKASYPNLSFELMDAQRMTFSLRFDAVFSNAALHWVIDHKPVLRGICQSLKPGGRTLLQMGGSGNAQAIIRIMDECISEPKWSPYFVGFSFPYGFYEPNQYGEWIREAGLTPKRIELIPKDMVHLGKEGLASWIRTTWLPYTQKVPIDLRDRLIEEVADKYIRHFPMDEKGLVHLKMVRLEVEATR